MCPITCEEHPKLDVQNTSLNEILLYQQLSGGTLCQRILDVINKHGYHKQLDKFINVKSILEWCMQRTCGRLGQPLGVINCWETVPRKYCKLIVCILY